MLNTVSKLSEITYDDSLDNYSKVMQREHEGIKHSRCCNVCKKIIIEMQVLTEKNTSNNISCCSQYLNTPRNSTVSYKWTKMHSVFSSTEFNTSGS